MIHVLLTSRDTAFQKIINDVSIFQLDMQDRANEKEKSSTTKSTGKNQQYVLLRLLVANESCKTTI